MLKIFDRFRSELFFVKFYLYPRNAIVMLIDLSLQVNIKRKKLGRKS